MEQTRHPAGRHSETQVHKNNYDIDIQACSSMDCTGLIPALPEDEPRERLMKRFIPTSQRPGNFHRDDSQKARTNRQPKAALHPGFLFTIQL